MSNDIETIVEATKNIFFVLRTDPEDFDEDGLLPDITELPVLVQNEISLFETSIRGIIYNHLHDDVKLNLIARNVKRLIKTQINDDVFVMRNLIPYESVSKCAYALLMWVSFSCISDEEEEEEESSESEEELIEQPTIIKFNGGNSEQ